MQKKCKKCGKVKDLGAFQLVKRPYGKKEYRLSPCMECRNAYQKDYRKKHWRMRLYGLSDEAYEDLNTAQCGLCAICKERPQYPLHVDHDHTTGKVRGLLCKKCNTGLGLLGDTRENLLDAVQYITK